MKLGIMANTVFIMCVSAYSKENLEHKKIFEGRYLAMKTAMANRSSDSISRLLSPGFESIDVSGKSESAEQMIKEVTSLPQDSTKKSQTTILSVQEKGDTAMIEQKYFMTKTKVGPALGPQKIELTAISKDIWVKRNGTWLILKTETESMDYKVNGKTAVHKER